MHRRIHFLVIIPVAIASITMEQTISDTVSTGRSEYENVSYACNMFTSDFYKVLLSEVEGNIVYSPLSIHMILSLLSNGAKSGTLEELQSILHHQDMVSFHNEYGNIISTLNDVKGVELHTANAMYVQEGIELLTEFLSVSEHVYQCSVSNVDFEDAHIADKINMWVKGATNNKISDLVSPDDFNSDTRIMLLNAIYFKGHWLHKFDSELTTRKVFHLSKTEKKFVPTMIKKSRYNHGEIPDLNATFIELPYMNEDIVMIIILPNQIDGFSFMEQNFTWKILKDTHKSNNEIELHLPKFKYEVTINLKNALQQIGLKSMFENSANFDRISEVPLKVSKVLQKAVIEVNEEGSEAAAVTSVQLRLRRMIHMPEEFVVDRPFMFVIEHKPSNIPLFHGNVYDIETSVAKDEL